MSGMAAAPQAGKPVSFSLFLPSSPPSPSPNPDCRNIVILESSMTSSKGNGGKITKFLSFRFGCQVAVSTTARAISHLRSSRVDARAPKTIGERIAAGRIAHRRPRPHVMVCPEGCSVRSSRQLKWSISRPGAPTRCAKLVSGPGDSFLSRSRTFRLCRGVYGVRVGRRLVAAPSAGAVTNNRTAAAAAAARRRRVATGMRSPHARPSSRALFLLPNDPAAVGACVSTPGCGTGGAVTAHSIFASAAAAARSRRAA